MTLIGVDDPERIREQSDWRERGWWYWRDRPAPSARAVWDLWREGVPAERNLRAGFDTDGRKAWADLTYRARTEYDINGSWGVKPGFTLVWNDAQVAHGAIRDYFASILRLLHSSDIDVDLRSTVDTKGAEA